MAKAKVKDADCVSEKFRGISKAFLDEWAGEGMADTGRLIAGRVKDLCAMPDGGLLATVKGVVDVVTNVWFDKEGILESECTCEKGNRCAHAVAVMIAYRNQTSRGKISPLALENDPRILLLDTGETVPDNSQSPTKLSFEALEKYVESIELSEARDLLSLLVHDLPAVRITVGQFMLANGNPEDRVHNEFRKERQRISEVIQKAAKNESVDAPRKISFEKVPEILENALTLECHNLVMDMATEILALSQKELDEYYYIDDTRIFRPLRKCCTIAKRAMRKSKRTDAEKIIWEIMLSLYDHHGILEGLKQLRETPKRYSKKVWEEVAEYFAEESTKPQWKGRMSMADIVEDVHELAGKTQTIVDVKIAKLKKLHDYQDLVDYLLSIDRDDEAEMWARKCLNTFPKTVLRLTPFSDLEDVVISREGWLDYASLAFEKFISDPHKYTYDELRNACEKVSVWSQVHPVALQYLQTGIRNTPSPWPLPDPGFHREKTDEKTSFPVNDALFNIALDEHRSREAWDLWTHCPYSELARHVPYGKAEFLESKLALTIQDELPNEAKALWLNRFQHFCKALGSTSQAQTMQCLYELRKIAQKQNTLDEWNSFVENYRCKYPNRHLLQVAIRELLNGSYNPYA